MIKSRIIAVDFDGTCVKFAYPYVGEDIGAAEVLKRLVENGHKIILLTMRDGGQPFRDAITWFNQREIPLFGINSNPEQNWSSSRKVYAHYYIDDQAVGAPLIQDPDGSSYINWKKVEEYFENLGLI